MLTVASLPLLLALFFSTIAFQQGTPGFKVDKTQHGLRVSQITDSHNHLVQAGDLIIAVNAVPYSRVLGQIFLRDDSDGSNSLTILRNKKRITVQLQTHPFSLSSFLFLAWPHFLLITVFLSLGTLALIYAPPSPSTRLFFLMLCGFSTAIASTLVSHTAIMEPKLISMSFVTLTLSNWFAFGAWIHFACRFPAERDLLKDHPGAAFFFYLLPPTVAVTGALFAAGPTPEFWPWLQRLRNLFLPLIILATFVKHTVDVIKLPPQPARNQIKLPLAAYWFSFGPYVFFYLLPNLLIDQPLIHFRTVILTFLFLPLAYLFALLRYRLFQVDRTISKALAYFILIASFTVLYSLFLVVLKRWLWQNQVLSENLFLVFLIVVVTLFTPLAGRLQKTIDRVIFGNQPVSPLLFHNLSRRISAALDIPELVQAVTHDLPEQIKIGQAAMLPLDVLSKPLLPKHPLLDPLKWLDSELVHTLEEKAGYLHCHAIPDTPRLSRNLEEIRASDFSMVFGLRGSSSTIGLLFIGPKLNGRLFGDEDIHFLSTLANHIGIALENSLRYTSLSESKRQLEELFEKLLQQKKMAAIGEMSTVLAHELRNPLTVIRSSAQHLSTSSPPPEIMEEMLSFIVKEVDSLNLTINSLLDFARHRPPERQAVPLQTSIPALIKKWLLSTDHHPGIRIECDIPRHLPALYIDQSQLGQILLNLIRNSEEAMGDSGDITLLVREDQDMAVIRVCDNGPGIPPDQLGEVFKNFFSTKKHGLGLGLPACRQLIQAHHGTITIKNRANRGTEVTLCLPFNPVFSERLP